MMDGKIVLEEHFALEDTWRDSVPEALPPARFAYLRDRLFDFDGPRIAEMDENGIALAILYDSRPSSSGIDDEVDE